MKTSFTAIASLILGASMAYAAFEPAATMVREEEEEDDDEGTPSGGAIFD